MENNVVYTLTYDTNGGEGVPAVATKNGNESYAIFIADYATPHRDGFVFSGWSFSPSASADDSMIIHGGDFFTVISREATLFAVWTEAAVVDETSVVSEEGEVEPLGVFTTSSLDGRVNGVSDAIGFAFIGAAVVLGVIALILFRQKEPRILSREIEEEEE